MSQNEAIVTARRRIPAIWLIPIVAALLGLWMVIYTLMNEGPTITLSFSTAEGIEAGQTKVKARSVDLGTVQTVTLGDDREHVVVTAKLDKTAESLLVEDTQFWVVRARVGVGGVSGLGTLLSGGFIELAPGTSSRARKRFQGLDEPPVTAAGTPGIQIALVSPRADAVRAGDPIIYRGYQVGRVEAMDFDLDGERAIYRAFVDAPYDALVTTATRFWNASGISFSAGPDGIKVDVGSLRSLAISGVAFDDFGDRQNATSVANGEEFTLFDNSDSARENPFRQYLEYVVSFDQSVRGLQPGAPVEFRGVPVGTVQRLLLDELIDRGTGRASTPIPVLIRVEPGRFRLGDDPAGKKRLGAAVEQAVAFGLHASLQTGNLLTGRLYVALDFSSDGSPGAMGKFNDWSTLPTMSTGLAQIEKKLGRVLDGINAIPLESIGAKADTALQQLTDTLTTANAALGDLQQTLSSEDTRQLPADLGATLAEIRRVMQSLSAGSPLYEQLENTLLDLNRTLEQIENLARGLNQKPNALVFPSKPTPDPLPEAKSR